MLGLKAGTLRKRLHDARARLQRQITEKAERELLLHLLPKDFAERCVCRCREADQLGKCRKEVITVGQKNDCDCGCKTATKSKQKAKK